MPRSAPLLKEVQNSGKQGTIRLWPVTPTLVAATREPATASFSPALLGGKPIDYERIASGDGIEVTIWERDGLQVYPAGAGGASDLGVFVVSTDGTIDIPFAGVLHVAGLSVPDARALLMERLSRIIVATDVKLALTDQRGGTVSVQGNVAKPGPYPLGRGMLRLGAALGLASPNQTNPEETLVTIRRGGAASTIRLADVYNDPAQDVALRPGDTIVVSDVQQYATVIGAVGGQGRVKIARRNYSVLDAVADSRGPADAAADVRALFLVRSAARNPDDADTRPLIYQFDMKSPEGLALAGGFVIRNDDIVFMSDAPFTQLQKVLSAISGSFGTIRSAAAISQ